MVLKVREQVRLSKLLALMLRHRPERFGLTLDEAGWTELEGVYVAITALRDFNHVNLEDLLYIVEHPPGNKPRKRYEIEDGKIRARYGHNVSLEADIQYPLAHPPPILYQGTYPKALESIMKEGLKPMGRQYVHLARSKEVAYAIGQRKTHSPVILVIAAEKAYEEGISFYHAGDEIYLADFIPAKYITKWMT